MSNTEVVSHLNSSIGQKSQITEFFHDAVALSRKQNTSTSRVRGRQTKSEFSFYSFDSDC